MGNKGSYSDGVRIGSGSSINIDFYYQGQRCRERLPLKPTPANLKKASQHRAAILSSIDNGTFDYQVTFPRSKNARKFMRQDRLEHYLRTWLVNKKPTLKASSYKDYKNTIGGQLIPEFGHLLLSELKRSHVRDWASKLTCSNKRISNLISPLRAALDDAMHDELITHNPLAGWHYRKIEPPKEVDDIDPFTAEEQAAILATLPNEGVPLIQFALWTGLRTSELVALEWGDIDWRQNRCRITRAITQASKGEAETTKTTAGTRTIDLLPRAVAALKAQKAISYLHPSGRVFINPRTAEPWTGDQAIRKTMWAHALKRAGVRYRRPYQTRHTYASMMVSSGEPLAWVSKQMGHTSVVTTARIYAGWIPTTNSQAGLLADQKFANILTGQHSVNIAN
ncbi:site-specific integrase [Vreelandella glaciei]|uniref:site-specific integrase n=1 Tax=Vreelandella glaciei TaxID=186761 RepID=UPI0030ECBC50|tara:strand:+ start:30913 stop:32097 length:1185 start_codon:yes stop_codon:yes gene_type:complete